MAKTVEQVDCQGEKHTISVITIDEPDKASEGDKVPLLVLNDHMTDDIRSEMVVRAMGGVLCGCMGFVVNWTGSVKAYLTAKDKKSAFALGYHIKK